MNWDYEQSSEQTRKDTRTYSQRRKQVGRYHLHIERNFPHGQGWLSSMTVNASRFNGTNPRVRLSLGGYRLGNPFGFTRYRGLVHISVLDLTLSILWRRS